MARGVFVLFGRDNDTRYCGSNKLLVVFFQLICMLVFMVGYGRAFADIIFMAWA